MDDGGGDYDDGGHVGGHSGHGNGDGGDDPMVMVVAVDFYEMLYQSLMESVNYLPCRR